eukprot:scaffold33284_cov69-Phaeocystis_antarctica.AAC.2
MERSFHAGRAGAVSVASFSLATNGARCSRLLAKKVTARALMPACARFTARTRAFSCCPPREPPPSS